MHGTMIIRRRDDMTKLEFVYMYRTELGKFFAEQTRYATMSDGCKAFINSIARPMLKYSPRTANVDIYLGLKRWTTKLLPIT